MIEKMEPEVTGVVCLHCGIQTPIPNSMSRGSSTNVFATPRRKISLIRCAGCGKEAPYLAEEIVVLERFSHVVSYAA
jgi:hypothetical protein